MAAAAAADGWNHNSHYHEALLRLVPPGCRRALDVGCGLGGFARRLSSLSSQVDALDRDASTIRRARELATHLPSVSFVEADFMTWNADAPYDFVAMIAVLHHLPFAPALAKAAGLVVPGGVFAVLGLDRAASLWHAGARSLIAYPLSGLFRILHASAPVGAPILDPTMTLAEIRSGVAELLPGATVRRHALWRYSLTWTAPRQRE